MEVRRDKNEDSSTNLELAAIASKAIEQVLARHKISQAELALTANESQQLIFEFFEELLLSNLKPAFKLYPPENQFFIIEALSGKCLKIDHAKLVKPYHLRNFAVEAAASFGGDSPATLETKVCAYRLEGSARILEAFAAIDSNVKSLTLTKAQIRHFCAKNADIILLRKMVPIFLFDRCELTHDCQEVLMTAKAWFDNYSLHISIGSTDWVFNNEEKIYLITPNENTEHDKFMLESMDIMTGI